ncbi:Cytochrome c nitrite reductase, small subunit NrfH [Nitrospira defluvii]|uniref:Cytochrome c nitrite reductase, small subunit NrfH n=2 Tax=Nitrospira defluvii TaxID=330214 RepID=A0ABN7LAR9_9BACT|nr:Cytochrome c nitrite reductase, small subunit NrfH [Nitrospira defluvii]
MEMDGRRMTPFPQQASPGAAGWFLAAALGCVVGIGLYTFVYARGASYLTDDPKACVNCHVMNPQYDGWVKSSHRTVAVCNDCHTPEGFVPKYASKAFNGFLHAAAFTAGRFPDEIQIKPHMRAIADQACMKCHAEIVQAINVSDDRAGQLSCVRCHHNVGHQ